MEPVPTMSPSSLMIESPETLSVPPASVMSSRTLSLSAVAPAQDTVSSDTLSSSP